MARADVATATAAWTAEIEEYVRIVADNAARKKRIHLEMAGRASRYNNILVMASIGFGPASGCCSALSTVFESREGYLWLSVSAAVLGMVSGVFAAAIKFGKHKETSDDHKQAAAYYMTLETSVVHQLNMDRVHRADVYEYLEWLKTSYADILAAAPLIRDTAAVHQPTADAHPATQSRWRRGLGYAVFPTSPATTPDTAVTGSTQPRRPAAPMAHDDDMDTVHAYVSQSRANRAVHTRVRERGEKTAQSGDVLIDMDHQQARSPYRSKGGAWAPENGTSESSVCCTDTGGASPVSRSRIPSLSLTIQGDKLLEYEMARMMTKNCAPADRAHPPRHP